MITDTSETKLCSVKYVSEGLRSFYTHIKRVVAPSHKNGITLCIYCPVWFGRQDYVERLVTGIPKFT